MKTKLTVIFAALAAVVHATTYHGTITETIAPFNDASGWMTPYTQGATYQGFYEYDSDTIDGTFTHKSWLVGSEQHAQ